MAGAKSSSLVRPASQQRLQLARQGCSRLAAMGKNPRRGAVETCAGAMVMAGDGDEPRMGEEEEASDDDGDGRQVMVTAMAGRDAMMTVMAGRGTMVTAIVGAGLMATGKSVMATAITGARLMATGKGAMATVMARAQLMAIGRGTDCTVDGKTSTRERKGGQNAVADEREGGGC